MLDDMNGIAWAGNKGWSTDRKQSLDEVERSNPKQLQG